MADDTPTKRPRYFNSQFLVLRDFVDEQRYHMEMLCRHNSGLHSWGVVKDGLLVGWAAPDLVIFPGLALDSSGREIIADAQGELFFLRANGKDQIKFRWDETNSYFVLPGDEAQAAATATRNKKEVYFTITFQEVLSDDPDDVYPQTTPTQVTRYKQAPLVKVEATPPTDGSSITLMKVWLDADGKLSFNNLDYSARIMAGSVGPLSFTTGTGLLNNIPVFVIDLDQTVGGLRIKSLMNVEPVQYASFMTILMDTGFVGIGTTSPNALLEVAGEIKADNIKAVNKGVGAPAGGESGGTGDRFILKSGSEALHPYSLGIDSDNLWYSVPTGAHHSWHIGGNEKLRIDSSGKVGIGTTQPRQQLEVAGNIQMSGSRTKLFYRGDEDNHIGSLGFYSFDQGQTAIITPYDDKGNNLLNSNVSLGGFGSFESNKVNLHVSGNVGIGTNIPQAPLHVGGLIIADNQETSPPVSGATGGKGDRLILGSISNLLHPYSLGIADGNLWYSVPLGSYHSWYLAGTERLRIDSTGFVGIGTPTPQYPLDVNGNIRAANVAAVSLKTESPNAGTPTVGESGGTGDRFILKSGSEALHPYSLGIDNDNLWYSVPAGARHSWHVGGTEMLRIDSSGNLGIGTGTPKAKLDVADTSLNTTKSVLARLEEGNTTGAGTYLGVKAYNTQPLNAGQSPSVKSFALEHYFVGSLNSAINFYRGTSVTGGYIKFATGTGQEKMTLDADGDLAVTGDVNITGRISCGGKIGIKSSNWNTYVSARSDKSVTHVSNFDTYEQFTLEMSCSRAFKENISDLTAVEAFDTLRNLTPVKYDYKGEKSFRQNLGFIAEEMPDNLASQDRKSISPFEVIPVLTRVAKEQQQTITALQETIRALQEEMQRHSTIINGDRI